MTSSDELHAGRTESSRANVLLVDSEPVVLAGLRATLQHNGVSAMEAPTVPQARQALETRTFDMVVLELALNGNIDLGLVAEVSTSAPVLVFSGLDENVFAERSLAAGASGYLRKTAPLTELRTAFEAIRTGRVYLSSQMTARVVETAAGRNAHARSPLDSLTNREIQVLGLLGQGIGTRRVAEQLGVSVKTIETHRAALKAKLRLPSASALMHYAVAWSLSPHEKRA